MAPKDKRGKREQLTDLVLEFLEVAVHQFLYVWQLYPRESFTKRAMYDAPVYMNRHPQLCEYIHSMLRGCRGWIRDGELEKLQIVLLSANGSILKRLCIEAGWNASILNPSGASMTVASSTWDQNDEPLPLRTLFEEFRSAIVALSASRITYGSDTSAPASFRLLAHTNEDASRSETAIDEATLANSWVIADRYWASNDDGEEHKSSADEKTILPIKSIRGEAFPLRMQLYLEEQ